MEHEIAAAALRVDVRKRRMAAGHPFVLDVSLEINKGITILFGASGAGKSTLLDCVAGFERPDAGKIMLGERILFDSVGGLNLEPQKRQIAYVFQSLALFPHLTAEQNVGYGLHGLEKSERGTRVMEILRAFQVERLATRNPAQLSGGEQQRVALARSLVTDPKLLLLDEPLTGLGADLKAKIVQDLRAWNVRRNIPIVYVTHSREEVDALGDRVVVLEAGKIVECGPTVQVLDSPRSAKLAQLAGFENLLTGEISELNESDGVTRVRVAEGCEIEVPYRAAIVGQRVQIAIRAGDVLLATSEPRGLSARNVMAGKIVALVERGTIVEAVVNIGVELKATITPGAVRTLGLEVGQAIWVILKTHSCWLVD